MIVKTFDRQTAKFLAVVGENMPELSGDLMQGWIQNPRAVQKVLSNAFCPPKIATPRFKVWKTIKLGTGLNTAGDFRRALRDGEFKLSNSASEILGKPAFTVAAEETEVDLVKVTAAELGFKKYIQLYQIYECAKKFGLELFPPEFGPQLRLQCQNQPNDEMILVAMEPVFLSDGCSHVFKIEHNDSGLWLNSHRFGRSGTLWCTDSQWVFCRARK